MIYELAQHDVLPVKKLRAALELDGGYASRLLGRLEQAGVVEREDHLFDGRSQVARLTPAGREAFAELDARSETETKELLEGLARPEQERLTAALRTARALLDDTRTASPRTVTLREPGPGDLGWVVDVHGRTYADEFGWDATFEALVARICAEYLERREPGRDAAWIAEVDGQRAGCVLCVHDSDRTAKLRLLLVDPKARGLGLGGRLVDECVRFARGAGFEELVLWTNDVLTDARRIYERAGFELVAEEPHRSFGKDLVGQTWRLPLRATPRG